MIRPFMGPWIFRASRAYSLHVGWYLHVFGSAGEMIHWYIFMGMVNSTINNLRIHLIRKKSFICSERLDKLAIDQPKYRQNYI
jgi:hypothetical protein